MALTLTSQPSQVHLANHAKFKLQTDDSTADFFYICIRVLVDENRDGSFVQVGPELKKAVNDNNEAEFDIHGFLQKHVTSHFTAYRGNTSINPAVDYDYVRKYKVEYYERAGIGQSIISNTNQTVTKRALQGGLTQRKENYYEETGTNFYTEVFDMTFLTNAPNKRIYSTQYKTDYLYLYFMPCQNIDYYLHINIYTASGVHTHKHTIQNREQFEVCMLSADISIILAHVQATTSDVFDNITIEDIYHYELYLENANGLMNERIRFEVQKQHKENIRAIAFNNNYGLLEILHTQGLYKKDNEYNYVTFKDENDKLLVEDAYTNGIVKANTGYITKEMLEYMNELFLSYSAYEIFDDFIQKIHFKKAQLPRPKSNVNLYQVQFEYRYDEERYRDGIDTRKEIEDYNWHGFRLIKGQTSTTVSAIGSDVDTIINKPVSSAENVYPAVVDASGNVVYKLGGTTGNDLTKKKGTTESSDLTGTDGEVMTVFEPFYYNYKIWTDGTNTYEDWMFSKEKIPGFTKTDRYLKGIYPAYYDSGADRLRSISSVTQATNNTRSFYRQKAANNGTGWCITPYFMENIIYHLWVAESLSLNSQLTISTGATNGSSGAWISFTDGFTYPVWTTGVEALSSYADDGGVLNITSPNAADVRHGEIPLTIDNWGDGTQTLNSQVAVMFHCRDAFGHIKEFYDGINIFVNSSFPDKYETGVWAYMSKKPGDFQDDTDENYELLGKISEVDSYISKFMEGSFLALESTGVANEHCGDEYYVNFGGSPDNDYRAVINDSSLLAGDSAGIINMSASVASDFYSTNLGARLCKIG